MIGKSVALFFDYTSYLTCYYIKFIFIVFIFLIFGAGDCQIKQLSDLPSDLCWYIIHCPKIMHN